MKKFTNVFIIILIGLVVLILLYKNGTVTHCCSGQNADVWRIDPNVNHATFMSRNENFRTLLPCRSYRNLEPGIYQVTGGEVEFARAYDGNSKLVNIIPYNLFGELYHGYKINRYQFVGLDLANILYELRQVGIRNLSQDQLANCPQVKQYLDQCINQNNLSVHTQIKITDLLINKLAKIE